MPAARVSPNKGTWIMSRLQRASACEMVREAGGSYQIILIGPARAEVTQVHKNGHKRAKGTGRRQADAPGVRTPPARALLRSGLRDGRPRAGRGRRRRVARLRPAA